MREFAFSLIAWKLLLAVFLSVCGHEGGYEGEYIFFWLNCNCMVCLSNLVLMASCIVCCIMFCLN